MRTIMLMIGGGLVGIATAPILSTEWLIGMAGCAIFIIAAFIDH